MQPSSETWETISIAFDNTAPLLDNGPVLYRYWARTTRSDHWRIGDLPGHRLGWRARKNLGTGHITYQGRCYCGAKQEEWTAKRVMDIWYGDHLASKQYQPSLF